MRPGRDGVLDAGTALRSFRPTLLRYSVDDLTDHVSFDIGQAEVATGVAVGQFFVIQSQQMQHRRSREAVPLP